MARARPELSKKRIKIGFPCAQILDIPLFEFSSKVCTRISAEESGHFTENYAENVVQHFTTSGISNICAHGNPIFIRSMESSGRARAIAPHFYHCQMPP